MRSGHRRWSLLVLALASVGLATLAPPSVAEHSWGNYHWGRTSNPLHLQLGSNVSPGWSDHLATASTDWNVSAVLNTAVVPGGTNPKSCRATAGRVEVCSSAYGSNGWLGLAQIWISGSHIVQGVVKVNDTYFSWPFYDTPAWRNFVMCQEVGHAFGLDHQDEDFDNANLGSCMDYTSDPSTNQHPDAHDYEQLAAIYAHLDATDTAFESSSGGGGGGKGGGGKGKNQDEQWGNPVRAGKDGRPIVYQRDEGGGRKVVTFVIWA